MGSRAFLSLLAWCLIASPALARPSCREDVVWLRGDWGQARFSVEVADDAAERGQGLMHRPQMPRMSGMLFVYPREQPVSFWMKNTLIPLDMIFADGRGVVQKVHENAVPGDLTAIPGGEAIRYVLEINAGMAERLGIAPGSEIRHPAVPPDDAAWPCEAE